MKSVLVGLKLLLISKLHLMPQSSKRVPSKIQMSRLLKGAFLLLVGHRLRAGTKEQGQAATWM